ncbi:HAD-like domain-containing protein [Staphylotrichum tortipilum]|uniref:HAD-like domain-containing protein n=1 Tax=Staphylotrichum tortipilum TaxID=2831512 RepID=A0AAN6ML07_9PEZI|nr:HAD-like domain-containing protein [Staphylotrichum longicolle]
MPTHSRAFRSDARSTGRKPPPSFAFDIDGVLLHVSKPIPGASDTLRFLQASGIPFILLTNGGGKPEAERVRDLSERLGVPLSTDNFIQSHTPFQELLKGPGSLRDKTVLVTGSDYEKCRAIFEGYGFRTVLTPADIYAADPTIFPFQPPPQTTLSHARPLPAPLYHPSSTLPLTSHLKIDAVFTLNDPRDWALDLQLLTDLLLSHGGYLGTYSQHNGPASTTTTSSTSGVAAKRCLGWQRDGQPPLYFSNADLLWSALHPLPRLGQGAFQAALAGVWARITGGQAELERKCIGKPYAETYRFAEGVLARAAEGEGRKLGRVYMVGDNPESDIAGANGFVSEWGAEWVSVLVRTGVWKEGRGGKLEGVFEPREVVDDVKAAVEWAVEREVRGKIE